MSAVAKAIRAAPDLEDGPKVLTYGELAKATYGTDEPNRAQRESVARACRRIISQGGAVCHYGIHRVPRHENGIARPRTPEQEARHQELELERERKRARMLLEIHRRQRNDEESQQVVARIG